MLPCPHTGENISSALWKCLNDYQIINRSLSIVLDNAANNTTAIAFFSQKYVDTFNIPLPDQFNLFHIHSCTHILNLIAKAGLEIIDGMINTLRETVKKLRASPGLKQSFDPVVASMFPDLIKLSQPSLDVATRWNSTYLMIQSSLPYKNAFRT